MNVATLSISTVKREQLFAGIAQNFDRESIRQAVVEPGRFGFSYGQLWPMLEELGLLLQQIGVEPSDVVAVSVPDGMCALISVLGVTRVCVCAPINPALAEAELERDLTELRAVAMIAISDSGTQMEVAVRLNLVAVEVSIDDRGCAWSVSPNTPSLRRYATVLPTGTAILLHTSATTGRRKIVPLSETNLLTMMRNSSSALQLTEHDRLLLMAKIFHIQGLVGSWAQLSAGGTVILGLEYSPQAFQHWLQKYAPTWFTGGPTLLRSILRGLESHPVAKPTSLRFLRSGGAILPSQLQSALQDALGVPILDVYGLTEVGGIASTTLGAASDSSAISKQRGVGRSIGPEVAIFGKDGALLGPEEEGQIATRGPNVMSGYVDDPEANRQAYRDGWFLTGDLGHLDSEGYLHVTGRIKEMINRGGQKIVPDEVDAVLSMHEAIREAATFAVEHPSLGEDVACAIVVRDGFEIADDEIREFTAAKLSSYKVPRTIYRLEVLPRGATGKPQRLVLRERFANRTTSEDGLHANEAETLPALDKEQPMERASGRVPTDLPESLAAIWMRCLNLEHVSSTDDFFAIGGDSLSAAGMLAQVETMFSLPAKLSDSRFFRQPTLTMLYRLCAEIMEGGASCVASSAIEIVPVLQGGTAATFYMAPSDGAEGFVFRQLARRMSKGVGLSLIRPGNLWHARSHTSIEDAGRQSAELILAQQAPGACVVGGFCYGGVVAYETARMLERNEKRCMLVLFDVPTPGFPRLLQDRRQVLRVLVNTLRSSLKSHKPRPALSLIRRVIRRAAWTIIRNAQPKNNIWRIQPLKWLCDQSQAGYFSFTRPTKIGIPILHIMATDAQDPLLDLSRHAWRYFAESGIETVVLTGEHDTLFNESNVKVMMQRIEEWIVKHQTSTFGEQA